MFMMMMMKKWYKPQSKQLMDSAMSQL